MSDQNGVTALVKHQMSETLESEFSAVTVKGITFSLDIGCKRRLTTKALAIADLHVPTFVKIKRIVLSTDRVFYCWVEKYQAEPALLNFVDSDDPLYQDLMHYSPVKLITPISEQCMIRCCTLIGRFVMIRNSSCNTPKLFAVPVLNDFEHD